MADATGLDLDEDLAALGLLDRDIFICPWCTGFFEDDCAAGLGDVGGHCS
jgi:hypothetical protein